MERLTERSLDYCTQHCPSEKMISCAFYKDGQAERCLIANMYDRLAAYEDTGLEPRECEVIAKSYPKLFDMVDELERYKKAEQESRLVVLPCKVGDTVYIVDRGKILEEEVIGFSTFNTKSGETVTSMTASYGYYVTRPNINDLGVLHSGNRLSFFFTREEAEAAMKGVSEDA